jgi:hypothetical protein
VADLDPTAVQQALSLVSGLGSRALQAVTGYDVASSRFRDASGRFQTASSVASGAFQGAANKIGSGGRSLAGSIEHVGATLHNITSGPLPSAEQAMDAVGAAIGSGITSASEKAAGALSKLGPEGAAAGAAIEGLGAVAAATVGTLTGLMGTAIEVTERATMLREALSGLAGGSAAGAAAGQQIQGLVDALPFAREQTQRWATSLLQVGESGDQLAAHVRAIAAAQALTAVTGGQGGAAAQQLFTRLAMGGKATESFMKQVHEGGRVSSKILAEMGLNIADLGGELAVSKMNAQQFGDAVSRALQKRGAGALDAMAGSFPAILQKAREGVLSLFDGLGKPVEGFMGAVKGLFGEFSKGGVAINVLKPIATSVLTTLFRWGTLATNAIHKGFLYVVVGALTAYIALRPVLDAIKRFASSAEFLTGLKVGLVLLAAPLVVLAVAFGVVASVVLIVIGVIGAVAGAVVAAVGAFANFVGSIVGAFSDAYTAATGAGGSIVDGLVAGVVAGAGRFVEALSGLASSGLAKFKGMFGIASPAKVMIEHGDKNIAGGLAIGVDHGSDKVDASMARLGAGGPGTPAGGGAGAAAGVVIQGDVNFNYSGPAEESEPFFEKARHFLASLRREAPVPT